MDRAQRNPSAGFAALPLQGASPLARGYRCAGGQHAVLIPASPHPTGQSENLAATDY